jgi:integrase
VLRPLAIEAAHSFPRRVDVPWVFSSKEGRQLTLSNLNYVWGPVRAAFTASLPDAHWLRRRIVDLGARRGNFDFYELRHSGATYLLDRGLSHEDVAFQLGHRDGGRLVRRTYGHPNDALTRQRIRNAFARNVAPVQGGSVAFREQQPSDPA